MSKKLKNLKWDSVALEGFPASLKDNFQGFVGLEECTTYGLDKENKRTKKKKPEKKRKNTTNETDQVPSKKAKPNNIHIGSRNVEKTNKKELKPKSQKLKLDNGFIVETITSAAPSLTNNQCDKNINKKNNTVKETTQRNELQETNQGEQDKNLKANKTKLKLGETSEVGSNLTEEDMLSWAEFKLPEPILRALAERGFKQPTNIQQLVLPAAIHGRRDILGAAETGSGKTLAFGLPILTGIMKLKEKAQTGLNNYDIPYKKTSAKKKRQLEAVETKKPNKKKKNNQKKEEQVPKESSEDGYSSGDESNDEGDDNGDKNDDDDFVEEIEVPVKKRVNSTDEGNDSDDSDNYVHLSDLLDSDDVDSGDEESKDSVDEEKSDENATDEESGDENSDDDDDANASNDESGGESNGDEADENREGIGCVKVIDNIEIPGHTVTKTGKPLFALILTPTRELAIQISGHLKAAAKYTGIRIATIVGGMAAVKQERVLRSGPEIVVATPGRLWELVTQGQPHLQQLDLVKFLAIDETDRMVERGHFEELQPLLERLNADEARRGTRQNFVFSATLTLVHDLPSHMRGKKVTKRGKIINRKVEKMTPEQKVKKLVTMLGMTDPKVVDITTKNLGTAETLTESRIACSLEHKDAYLYYILKRHPGRTIVFCNSITSVKRLAQLFTTLNCRPLPLHAGMQQRQRLKNLEKFRDDPRGVLVATDVAARGLDIPNVDHVIHYQVPRTAENYVHRSGRTARAHKEGLTILMMEPAEAYLYSKLCRTLNKTSEVPTFPVPPQLLAPLKDLVTLARDLDALEMKRKRSAQALGWREKVAKEMDIIVDDDNAPVKRVDPSIDKALQLKRRQLTAMLARPLFPKGFSFKYPTLNDPSALSWSDEGALQVMKNAIESGEIKKEKRKSKNAPLLKLGKTFKKK